MHRISSRPDNPAPDSMKKSRKSGSGRILKILSGTTLLYYIYQLSDRQLIISLRHNSKSKWFQWNYTTSQSEPRTGCLNGKKNCFDNKKLIYCKYLWRVFNIWKVFHSSCWSKHLLISAMAFSNAASLLASICIVFVVLYLLPLFLESRHEQGKYNI